VFSKICIANRGEIAVRIIRACKEMGISTVAVYSEADRDALHVSLADESLCIGPAAAKNSYLNHSAVLSAALAAGAQAVHPGYGLLSENAEFASKCIRCGLTFIGPPPEILRKMGDKNEARRAMREAGIPVIPGSEVVADAGAALAEADRIGYPVLLKACAGGGGRGIRRVDAPDTLESAFQTASSEAKAAFGDGTMYMERFISPVKHIETQLLCDRFGRVVCLGERECSVQRRNQKLVEESPAPVLTEKIRRRMWELSVEAARAIGYQNAGTMEFLLDTEDNFYFMEMNTRLQVEHPVTEMVTGIDLVKWQIRVAAGLPLAFEQADIHPKGHAIECRINAETRDGRPSCGSVSLLHVPGGPWVRFDTALYQGYTVPPFYDSMIGKLIVHAQTREEAIRKMHVSVSRSISENSGILPQTGADLLQHY